MRAKVGLIGCGNISDTYITNNALFSNFEIVAVADLNMARAKAKAEQYSLRALEVGELLASEVEFVLNLTVPAAHAEVGLQVLEAGKNLYGEKPLAASLGEAGQMLEAALRKGLRIGCAPDTFMGAGFQAARRVVDQGQLGSVVAASAAMFGVGPQRWHPSPEFFFKSGAGPLFDMGPYYLTALVHLLGPVKAVNALAKATFASREVGQGPRAGQRFAVETPTHVSALLEFHSGTTATFTLSFDAVPGSAPNIALYGTEASLQVGNPNLFSNPLRLRRVNDLGKPTDWQDLEVSDPYQSNCRGLGLADMIDAVRHNRPHRASAELAYHVLEALQAVVDSAHERRWVALSSQVERPQPLDKVVL